MRSPVTEEQLIDLAEGRVSEAERPALLAEVNATPELAREFARIVQMIDLMNNDHSTDAPLPVIARALGVFQARANSQQPTLVQRWIARLTFDSAQAPLAAGLRSTGGSTRQLLYHVDEHDVDIDIRIAEGTAGWIVSGQVLGGEEHGTAVLLPAGLRMTLGDLSEFTFPPVAPGAYSLVIHASNHEIEIPDLTLGLV
jgi:anti-sigma factor RsiW